MGGPEVPWAAGRSDAADGSTSPPDGRLPDADKGSLGGTVAHLRAIHRKNQTSLRPRLNHGLHVIDVTAARRRGGAIL